MTVHSLESLIKGHPRRGVVALDEAMEQMSAQELSALFAFKMEDRTHSLREERIVAGLRSFIAKRDAELARIEAPRGAEERPA